MKRTTFEQFDVVYLTTTKNVQWMIDLPGRIPDPDGPWTIVCTYSSSGRLLIQKDTALCLVPASDIKKVANYNVQEVFQKLDLISKKYQQRKSNE